MKLIYTISKFHNRVMSGVPRTSFIKCFAALVISVENFRDINVYVVVGGLACLCGKCYAVCGDSVPALCVKILQIASATQDPTPLACLDWLQYTLNEAYASGVSTKCLKKPAQVKEELKKLETLRAQQQAMQNEAMAAAANRDNAAAENYLAQYQL